MKRRDARLVPIAEFTARAPAEQAWTILNKAGIAASVVSEPASLGAAPVTRIYVARIDVADAQPLIAEIVGRDR